MLQRDIDGVRQLYPEWNDTTIRRGRVVAVGPYDGRAADRSTSQSRPYARSRALRRADLAAPGWTGADLSRLVGADVVFSFNAVLDWLRKGEGSTEFGAAARLYDLPGMAVALNQLRAWNDPELGWRAIPTERLIRQPEAFMNSGIGVDVVNSVYLLFEGPPLPLDATGLDPELEGLCTVADFQIRATYEPLEDETLPPIVIPDAR